MGNLAQALRDYGQGVGETALSLGSGMAAQIPAGVAGILEFLRSQNVDQAGAKKSFANAADKVRDVAERYTYEPRGDVAQRGLENIGNAVESVTEPVKAAVVDPIGDRFPAAGAAILAGAELIGPKGAKAKPRPHPKATPEIMQHIDTLARQGEAREREAASRAAAQYDPLSHQQLIPGVEPITATEAHAQALRRLGEAREGMSFDDRNAGLRFDFDPNWRGGGPTYEMNYAEVPEGEGRVGGKRPVARVSQRPITLASLEEPGSRTLPQGEMSSHNTVQQEVGAENFQRMMALAERLRGAEGEARSLGNHSAATDARALNQQILRRRALTEEPGINPEQRLALEEEILSLSRRRPMDVGGNEGRVRMVSPQPNPAEGPFSPMRWLDAKGDDATQAAREYLRERPGYLDVQKRTVRRLRGEPEDYGTSPRAPAAPRMQLEEVGGRDANAMNRDTVEAFLDQAQGSEPLFQFGLAPPPSVRSLDDFAAHFSKKTGEPIRVDWEYADNDEPYKIKQEKTHGRGEVMRDRHGDYIGEGRTHEAGNYPMYDYRGDLKEVEAKGPTKDGEPLMRKKVAEGGETKFDEYGDNEFEYAKSRGGEPMRDERGRVKYEEVENPDYGGNEVDKAVIHGPSGKIDIEYGEPAYMGATEARAQDKAKAAKGLGGQLPYQVALAHAARQGIDIGTGSLTDINTYRLLSNTLSNYARMGENPREVTGTLSGRADRARGKAEGPELWRAEAEEGRSRLLQSGTDPDRVTFHPENGFSIDGKPALPEDIKSKMAELSPRAGAGGITGGVGQKSLMRNAVFEWLRNASPEDARRVAQKWPKEWGPIFAGVGAAALGLQALPDGEEQRAD